MDEACLTIEYMTNYMNDMNIHYELKWNDGRLSHKFANKQNICGQPSMAPRFQESSTPEGTWTRTGLGEGEKSGSENRPKNTVRYVFIRVCIYVCNVMKRNVMSCNVKS